MFKIFCEDLPKVDNFQRITKCVPKNENLQKGLLWKEDLLWRITEGVSGEKNQLKLFFGERSSNVVP